MIENREIKSDVFSMLMEDQSNALQVYNALNGSNYDDPSMVEIVTLKKGVSLSIRNDASFILDMNLSIYEHQSTYSPNMPLRSLIYLVEMLKPYIADHDIFGRKLIKIPTPKFAVFYNGRGNRPAIETLKISDAFEKKTDNPELELICTVYNINPGKNDVFLAECQVLTEYMQFIECVRMNDARGDDNPIENAIEYCIRQGILADFLRKRKDEVVKAMVLDYTFERREELIRRDERNEGREEGRKEGREEGRKQVQIKNVRSLMDKMSLSLEQALDALSITGEEREEVIKVIAESES